MLGYNTMTFVAETIENTTTQQSAIDSRYHRKIDRLGGPNSESDSVRMLRAEHPYAEEFLLAPPEDITLLAVHATDMEKAGLALISGSLLTDSHGLSLYRSLYGEKIPRSAHPSENIHLSVSEVDLQYSIKEYPEGAERWRWTQGEVFFATPAQKFLESDSFKGFTKYKENFFIDYFQLEGDDGLLKRAMEREVPVPEILRENAADIDARLQNGELTPQEYLGLVHLFRQTSTDIWKDQTFFEVESKKDIQVGNSLKLFMPESFRDSFRKTLEDIAERVREKKEKAPNAISLFRRPSQYDEPDETKVRNILQRMYKDIDSDDFIDKAMSNIVFYSDDIPTGAAAMMHYSNKKRAEKVFQ